MGRPPENCHDDILLMEWCSIAPLGSFIRLGSPGKGSRGHEAPHHGTVLEFVPDRVGMVRANLLKKPLEVIYRCPFPVPDAACGSGRMPHTRAANFLAVVVVMAGCGYDHGPQGHCLRCLLPFLTLGGTSLSLLRVACFLAYAGQCMTAS
jgi:hypothetical protein